MSEPDANTEIAKLFAMKLIERRDRKAIMFKGSNGRPGYMPHVANSFGWRERGEEPEYIKFRMTDLVEHVEGARTYGHYVVDPTGNTCRMFCFDIDLEKIGTYQDKPINPRQVWAGPTSEAKLWLAKDLITVAHALAIHTRNLLEIVVTISYSGNKGFHVIGQLDPGTPAADARAMMQLILDSFDGEFKLVRGHNFFKHDMHPNLSVETYPKQEEVEDQDSYGNLLRLPLGVHLATGKQGFFLDMTKPFGTFGKDDPITALTRGSIR